GTIVNRFLAFPERGPVMKRAWWLLAGFGIATAHCGDSSGGGDLFAPAGAGGTQAAGGVAGSASTTSTTSTTGAGGMGTTSAGGTGTGGGGAGGAGGVVAVDAGTDSGRPLNLHCGNTFCSAPTEFCCIEGATARCLAATSVGNCPDSAAKARCDDHTDCFAGQ